MDIAEECLETPIEDFRLTITDIVDNIEVRRQATYMAGLLSWRGVDEKRLGAPLLFRPLLLGAVHKFLGMARLAAGQLAASAAWMIHS
jgi:hypothetical protein